MDGNDPYLRVMTKILGQRMDDHSRHSSWSRHHHTQDVKIMRLRLFNLNMPANDTLEACIYCERGRASNGVDVGLFVAYSSDESKEPIYRYQRANFTAVENSDEIKLSLHADNDKAHAVQLGAYFLGQIEAIEPLPLLDILSITIKPKLVDSRITTIEHIRTITRGQGTCKEKRLAWEWQGGRNTEIDGLPWSTTTGPFSHFIIMMANQELGSAYSLEFPLRENDYHAVGKNASDVDICVKGFLFGGGCVSSQTVIPATSLFSSD